MAVSQWRSHYRKPRKPAIPLRWPGRRLDGAIASQPRCADGNSASWSLWSGDGCNRWICAVASLERAMVSRWRKRQYRPDPVAEASARQANGAAVQPVFAAHSRMLLQAATAARYARTGQARRQPESPARQAASRLAAPSRWRASIARWTAQGRGRQRWAPALLARVEGAQTLARLAAKCQCWPLIHRRSADMRATACR